MNPILAVLLYSSLAAAVAAVGVLPLVGRESVPSRWVGWASALAAGMMLGAAYMLMAVKGARPIPEAAGAALGILFIAWTHAVTRTSDLDLRRLSEQEPAYGYQVVLIDTLHSASEGVAIGLAAVVDLSFGLVMAFAMAVHNIPEATILGAVLRAGGVRLGEAAGLAVATNLSQILLAVATFAVVSAAPGVLPWGMGFAAGALLNLVMVELLPESYREAGHTSIALVTSVALGLVVLLNGMIA
ncbi:MAG: ZIP family metal transporter [Gemmatimonadota bacterium]